MTEQVGSIIRARREELGLSLKQVFDVIRIRPEYLQTVEDGDPDGVLPDVYHKGYIRLYGNYLGLDGPALVRMYVESKEQRNRVARVK